MIDAVVCFKWRSRFPYRTTFLPETVNVLRRMVARRYPHPHEFICVTDDAEGLDAEIRVVPLWDEFADVPSPNGQTRPSCYRRLKVFSREMASVLGQRFVVIDLDVVFTGDVTSLWHRREDFVIYGDTHPTTPYNGSMFLLRAGARAQVYETFDPKRSPATTHQAGMFGSDQAWISFCLGAGESKWGRRDGVYSFRNHVQPTGALPADARMVVFHGRCKPWDDDVQQRHPWVSECWQ